MTVSTLSVVPEAPASGTAPCAEPPRPWRRPRLLDLFCGAGGASMGYYQAGFDVTGVDRAPQPDYPFRLVQADALTVDLDGFDVVAASPPCQRWCRSTPPHRRREHPDLIGPVRDRLRHAVTSPGGPWAYVIENVPGAPLHRPVTVCGDALRLGVRRHRLFESNIPLVGTGCWHDRPQPPVAVYGTYNQSSPARRTAGTASATTEAARTAMGIDWMPWPALTQAIPPAYTFWLGVQLLAQLTPETLSESGPYVTETAAESSRPPAGSVTPAGGETSRLPAGSVTHVDGETSPGSGNLVPAAGRLRRCRCGRPLPPRQATGRWPRYCSQACRQAAYRDRRHGRQVPR